MSDYNNITKIHINFDYCIETDPCRHNVSLEYQNGLQKNVSGGGGLIYKILVNNPNIQCNIDIHDSWHLHIFDKNKKEHIKNLLENKKQ
jgi:hypothetical protein